MKFRHIGLKICSCGVWSRGGLPRRESLRAGPKVVTLTLTMLNNLTGDEDPRRPNKSHRDPIGASLGRAAACR